MTKKVGHGAVALVVTALSALTAVSVAAPVSAEAFGDFDPALTYGSVETVPNPDVVDTAPLRRQSLAVQEAFVERVLACGYVDDVVDALSDTGAISTIDDDNSTFAVGAGGFAGRSTASIVYTIEATDAATVSDIEVVTNSLGYVFSQGSAFLLDADDPDSFDFPANYAVLLFDGTPPIGQSAALFETVGDIDPELFETGTSGYTQYGPAYLTLQSAVSDARFIAGYVAAAEAFGIEYTPVVDGEPALHRGGAAFPANDWEAEPDGDSYLARIPAAGHDELGEIRADHLRLVDHAQRVVGGDRRQVRNERALLRAIGRLPCRR